MRSAFTSLVALSTILSPVLAAPQQPALSSTTQCATKYGPRSTQVSTQKQTSTKTVRSTATVYTTKQVVVTPRPLTITVISNVISTVFTTLSTSTGTFTSTITDTSVASTTQTQTAIVSATQVATVSLVSTTAVPASAGFTPLASSLPGAGRKKRGTRNFEARKPLLKGKWEKDGTKEQATCQAGGPKPGYAQKVDCTVIVTTTAIVSTRTSTRFTTTLAAAPTVTRTNGVTSVSTVTVLPEPARTTVTTRVGVTTTTTIQTIQTSTITTTVTETVFTSTTTAYAACASDNVIGSYNGGGLVGWGFNTMDGFQATLQSVDATTALECCARAQANPNTWFYSFYTNGNIGCDIIVGSSCPVPGTSMSKLFYDSSSAPGSVQISGNGQCGVLSSAMSA